MVKQFNWNDQKNEKLKKERQISFENVVFAMEHEYLLDIVANPNQTKYPGQKLFLVQIDDYVYVVPFDETESEIFLITIIPNRKMTIKYSGGK